MDPINLFDYEVLARKALEPASWDYYEGGSDDEITVRANRLSFERIRLRPHVLRDVSAIDVNTTVQGMTVRMPILVAPTAYQGLAHPEGEYVTAQATRNAGTVMIASTFATRTLEEIRGVASDAWMQLYFYRDSDLTASLVRCAEQAGYRAIVLTVDTPYLGRRERDIRNHFKLPPPLHVANFADKDVPGEYIPSPDVVTWETIRWLRPLTSLPILLKGIVAAEDALIALEYGINGIIVSNHGGRQLDGTVASIDALPEVARAVASRCEVYVDGGIRRGTDVLKALALGAHAVLVGRPILWGLAVNGVEGVQHVLELLYNELTMAMALAGCPTLKDIDRLLIAFDVNTHIPLISAT
ncbi:MAG TPA: alpha-hydroxy acid oxidase [Ktedonobacteraceae bacterium]|nr:alpha-hydroxy acid oxidase [Ktedonobacteraceae bacterium]